MKTEFVFITPPREWRIPPAWNLTFRVRRELAEAYGMVSFGTRSEAVEEQKQEGKK